MPEKLVCNNCGATYPDEESIELAKRWISEGYAPCPIIPCPGELVLTEA